MPPRTANSPRSMTRSTRVRRFRSDVWRLRRGQVLPTVNTRARRRPVMDDRLDERADRHDENANRAEHRIGIARMLESRNTAMRLLRCPRAGSDARVAGFPRLRAGRCRSGRHHTRSAASPRSLRLRGRRPDQHDQLAGNCRPHLPDGGGQSQAQTFRMPAGTELSTSSEPSMSPAA